MKQKLKTEKNGSVFVCFKQVILRNLLYSGAFNYIIIICGFEEMKGCQSWSVFVLSCGVPSLPGPVQAALFGHVVSVLKT